ncbi:hypothetical protein [uncultured Tateyamaria sp.]|uniref:hypothetical protein n=1 Tax=uncultured Tateyamaria sp. TaxID=455651 RepID=UPI00262F70F6|nr:hypothetical protein [uncultured Tateyamaria sp.]
MRLTLALLVFVLTLAACNSAGPYFRGLPATTVTVDGSTFDVRVNGRLAEAIRTNVEYAPRFGPIRTRAKYAMEQVSGCPVKEVRGDQAQITGILKCGDDNRPIDRSRPQGDYECITLDSYISPATNELVLDLDCDLI